jgi:hypothetical protein
MYYVIENTEDIDLLWSNQNGWTGADDYDVFTAEEKEQLNLPMGGRWRVEYRIQSFN